MKIASAVLATLLLAGSAFADDAPSQPDYSRDGMQKVFAVDLYQPPKPQPFNWENMFFIDWTALGTRWHIRPMLAPLQGSFPVTTGLPIPNAFALTGTQLATTARTFRDERALSSERRKVEKIIRKHAHIVVSQ